MDGFLAASVTVPLVGLVGWFLWMRDRREERAHQVALRGLVVQVDQVKLDSMAGRLSALEAELKELRWKK